MASETQMKVLVEIGGDNSKFKSVAADTEKTASSSGEKSGKGFGALMAAGVQLGVDAIEKVGKALINFTKDSLKEYNDIAQSVSAFNTAAGNVGWSKDQIAAAQEANGVISAAANRQAAQVAAAAGVQGDAYAAISKQLDNYVVATGKDAPAAATLFSKAIVNGMIGPAARAVPALKNMDAKQFESMSQSERAKAISDALAKSVDNANAVYAKTPSGQMKVFANSVDELKESFGGLLEGATSPDEFTKNLNNVVENGAQIFATMAPKIATAIGTAVTAIGDKLPGIIKTTLPILIKAVSDLVKALVDALPSILSALGAALTDPSVSLPIAVAVAAWFGGKAVLSKVGAAISGLGKTVSAKLSGVFAKAAKPAADAMKPLSDGLGGVKTANDKLPKTFTFGASISNFLKNIGQILSGAVSAIIQPIQTLLKGIGDALAGFMKAFADPAVLMGALGFAAAAAAIAAAILLIGGAIDLVGPGLVKILGSIVSDVLLPLVNTIFPLLITFLAALSSDIIAITQNAIVPLAAVIGGVLIGVLKQLPAILNSVGGIFTSVFNGISKVVTSVGGVIKDIFNGISGVVKSLGEGFKDLGAGIKTALDGVADILNSIGNIINKIASAIVAVVALTTGHSIKYGAGYATLTAKTGGYITGAGTATSDSIPARLSDGEYVIKAASVNAVGTDALDYLNRTGEIPAAGAGGNTQYITVNAPQNADPLALSQQIGQRVRWAVA